MVYLVLIFIPFIILAILSPFIQRKTCNYTFNGHKIRVFCGWINAHLYIDNKLVDHQRCWGEGMQNIVLQHKQDGMEIFVRTTSGIFRPRITCKINNELITPD